MKVFLSWSGRRSRMVAEALNDWLPRLIQVVRPFYSAEIEKGTQWGGEIDDALEGTKFGIVCLTRDNLESRWIHYEAGALSRTAGARIWTLLLDVRTSDVGQPLGKFQATIAEREDILQLVRAINGRLADVGGQPLPDRLLDETFDVFWPRLEAELRVVAEYEADKPAGSEADVEVRDTRAVLDEILAVVRAQERRFETMELSRSSAGGLAQTSMFAEDRITTPRIQAVSDIEIDIIDTERFSGFGDALRNLVPGTVFEAYDWEVNGGTAVRMFTSFPVPMPLSHIQTAVDQAAAVMEMRSPRWVAKFRPYKLTPAT